MLNAAYASMGGHTSLPPVVLVFICRLHLLTPQYPDSLLGGCPPVCLPFTSYLNLYPDGPYSVHRCFCMLSSSVSRYQPLLWPCMDQIPENVYTKTRRHVGWGFEPKPGPSSFAPVLDHLWHQTSCSAAHIRKHENSSKELLLFFAITFNNNSNYYKSKYFGRPRCM